MSDPADATSVGMSPESWERIELLLDEALARPDAERATFLDGACGGDAALRREIEVLIDAHARTEGPLERLVADLGSSGADNLLGTDWVGRRIGPYVVQRELGRGGMGAVYLARRADGQYDRHVALKVIQCPLEGSRRARFLAERQILARLAHAGIAQLFDGGLTDAGLPYFTMEYVDGVPIDRYCDEHAFDIPARLQLFLKVCDAVAAAHRSLIIHRDLKPTNILATPDGVKLVDFGIAKPLDPTLDRDLTRTGAELFTPDYASPEQVAGAPITTASDVYSLGAVLYQLLTGLKPHRFTSRTPVDVERTICERDPPPPSHAIAALQSESSLESIERADAIARARRTDPGRLKRQLAGDLDVILMKALSKDPARRYPSVDLLRQDIANHLQGLPVTARPDSRMYRARKFIRRHRAAVLAGALAVASLSVGLVATLIQAERAREQRELAAVERDRARAEAARVKRVSGLITGLFRLADPEQSRGQSITAREILERGAQRVDAELTGDPETQAVLFDTIGQVDRNLALYDAADRLLRRSLDLRTKIFGSDSLEVAESLHNLAQLRSDRNDYAAAEAGFRQALALRRRRGARSAEIAASLEGLGAMLSEAGKHGDAEPILREALELRRREAPDAPETVATINNLALTLHRKGSFKQAEPLFREAVERSGRFPESVTPARVSSVLNLALLVHRFDRNPRAAEPLYREAVSLARRLYPSDHPDVATCLSEFARDLRDLGNLAEAEATGREALAMWRRLYGSRHREVMISTQTLAGLLADRDNAKEAEALFREALAMGRSLFTESHPLVLGADNALASFLEARGRLREALPLRETEFAGALRQYGENHTVVARALMGLGRGRLARGQRVEAEQAFGRALAIRQRIHPPGHWRIAEASVALGDCLRRARRFREAEALLQPGYETLRSSSEAAPEDVRSARNHLIELYESWGRPQEAARYRTQRLQANRGTADDRHSTTPRPDGR